MLVILAFISNYLQAAQFMFMIRLNLQNNKKLSVVVTIKWDILLIKNNFLFTEAENFGNLIVEVYVLHREMEHARQPIRSVVIWNLL